MFTRVRAAPPAAGGAPDSRARQRRNAAVTTGPAAVPSDGPPRPVLIDDRTVRLPSGRDVAIGPGLTEFRSDADGVVTRFDREGTVREYGWKADPSAASPQDAVWGSAWSLQTEPGVRVHVDATGKVLSFPHGIATLPSPLGALIQDGDRYVVIVQTHINDTGNVYCYDDHGRRLWQIGAVPPAQPAEAWAAIDVASDGTLTAMNPGAFTATIDRDTGAVLSIKKGRW